MMSNCGVYVIRNTSTGKSYVGSTLDFAKRKLSHLSSLRRVVHVNRHLQAAFNKYGEDSFQFELVETCEANALQEAEQRWIDRISSSRPVYNLLKTAYSVTGPNHPMFGHAHTEAAKHKIRRARAQQIISHSPETRARIGAANKGRMVDSAHIRRMVEARQGRAWNKGITAEDKPSLANKHRVVLPHSALVDVVAEYRGGMSINSISRKHGYDWEVIKRELQRAGVKTRTLQQQKIHTDRIREKKASV